MDCEEEESYGRVIELVQWHASSCVCNLTFGYVMLPKLEYEWKYVEEVGCRSSVWALKACGS